MLFPIHISDIGRETRNLARGDHLVHISRQAPYISHSKPRWLLVSPSACLSFVYLKPQFIDNLLIALTLPSKFEHPYDQGIDYLILPH